jgi:hypothetical protein
MPGPVLAWDAQLVGAGRRTAVEQSQQSRRDRVYGLATPAATQRWGALDDGGTKAWRCSQYASVGPATLAPAMEHPHGSPVAHLLRLIKRKFSRSHRTRGCGLRPLPQL